MIDLIEKPNPEEAPSNLAIAGRYIFSPLIFDMIRRIQPDKRGEIQITDAIRLLCEEGKRVMAVQACAGREALRHRQLPQLLRNASSSSRWPIRRMARSSGKCWSACCAERSPSAEARAMKPARLFLILFLGLLAARLCHVQNSVGGRKSAHWRPRRKCERGKRPLSRHLVR